MSLRKHLLRATDDEQSQNPLQPGQSLSSPLAERLIAAVQDITAKMPQVRVVTGGLVKYLRAGRISDDEIRSALIYLTSMCTQIMDDRSTHKIPTDYPADELTIVGTEIYDRVPDDNTITELLASVPSMNGAVTE